MTAYDFHPEAGTDLDEIWEYIAADNVDAADRLIMRPSVSPVSANRIMLS